MAVAKALKETVECVVRPSMVKVAPVLREPKTKNRADPV
jgi:hypothetical protein